MTEYIFFLSGTNRKEVKELKEFIDGTIEENNGRIAKTSLISQINQNFHYWNPSDNATYTPEDLKRLPALKKIAEEGRLYELQKQCGIWYVFQLGTFNKQFKKSLEGKTQ